MAAVLYTKFNFFIDIYCIVLLLIILCNEWYVRLVVFGLVQRVEINMFMENILPTVHSCSTNATFYTYED